MASTDKSSASDTSGGRSTTRHAVIALAAIAVWSVGAMLAFQQPPRLSATTSVSLFSPDWWAHPLETDGFRRLPTISGNLHAITIREDGELWAVGERGLIVRSHDGGRQWERIDAIEWVPQPAAKAAAEVMPKRAFGLRLIESAYAGEPPATLTVAEVVRIQRG